MTAEKKIDEEIAPSPSRAASLTIGTIEKPVDIANREFYGNSISDSYRMKSELISQCMEQTGMGRYQWILFAVAGFGGLIDNL
jgi:hypothetical protein